jgi:trypsin
MRPDRDEAEYLELASRYTSSVALGERGGEGVLIAPRWVLTAARVARGLQAAKPAPAIAIGGRPHEIESFHIHPDWKDGGHSDIALILLREPVAGIEPAAIYRARDEGGQGAIVVGHGFAGRIGERAPAARGDLRARAGINTVDRVSPLGISLRIKPPDDASDLQGASVPGDEGGAAYIERDGIPRVAGIAFAIADTSGDGVAGNAGDWDLYTRVSSFAEWIDATMWRAAREQAGAKAPAARR